MTTMKKKRKVGGGEAFICANCCEPCTSGTDFNGNKRMKRHESECVVHEILLNLNKRDGHKSEGGEEKMDIKTALSSIYKLKVVNELNLDGCEESAREKNVVLCTRCGEVLQTLYILFDEFNHLRKGESYLDKKISQLDGLLSQLQETWTEMTTITDEADLRNTHHDDGKIWELMITKDKVSASSLSRSNNFTDDTNQVQIMTKQVKLLSSSSNVEEKTDNLCSTIEQRIMDEINAITGTKLTGLQNDDYEPRMESEEENDDYFGTNPVDYNQDASQSYRRCGHCYKTYISTADLKTHVKSCPARTGGGQDKEVELETKDQFEVCDTDDSDWDTGKLKWEKRTRRREPGKSRVGHFVEVVEDCPLCPSRPKFDQPSDKSEHFLSHHLDQNAKGPMLCLLCKKSFTKLCSLRTHIMAHAKDHRFVCSYPTCAKTFLTSQQLDMHNCVAQYPLEPRVKTMSKKLTKRSKNNTEKHPRYVVVYQNCPLCPHLSISLPSELSDHWFSAHRSGDDTTCPICRKNYSTLQSLATHLRAHSADLRFDCPNEECHRKFLTHQLSEIHAAHCCGGTVVKSVLRKRKNDPGQRDFPTDDDEVLILENVYIPQKKHHPTYQVLDEDDKSPSDIESALDIKFEHLK